MSGDTVESSLNNDIGEILTPDEGPSHAKDQSRPKSSVEFDFSAEAEATGSAATDRQPNKVGTQRVASGFPLAKVGVIVGVGAVAVGGALFRRFFLRKLKLPGSRVRVEKILLERFSVLPPPQPPPPQAPQALRGLTFAVSDVFDIEGRTCSIGKPEWKANTDPATATAPIVQLMLNSGAELVGATNVSADFLSLHGRNPHYGTPANPAAPGHITGGCHGGAAAAVAAGLA
eukprot:CAMPEP_0177583676 /NCGR_PEP_ID=MMETSP0419_2-20121207/3451_1 /TAXON_ID=582737 /ORGANISM="Tetraselmis sp., Strain GSL018" /LENGTH=230 /DNA_ID=CAMNT_0019073087 /DNA_START=89 /DNA_END=778 /DNA_ORIENTATION=+